MGWNFGGILADCALGKVAESLEPDRRVPRTGAETPEELASLDAREAGDALFGALGLPVGYGDAPVSFRDATRRDFESYAVGAVGQKTVALGMALGLDQDSTLEPKLAALSARFGDVLAFWFNDASDTFMFSVFRGGKRVRFRARGDGLSDDEGAKVPGEPTDEQHPHDHQLGVLEAFTGCSFPELLDLQLERFG